MIATLVRHDESSTLLFVAEFNVSRIRKNIYVFATHNQFAIINNKHQGMWPYPHLLHLVYFLNKGVKPEVYFLVMFLTLKQWFPL